VYLVIVFLSMILPILWLSSKLKRNLIIDQNLTHIAKEILRVDGENQISLIPHST
jgi:hypothetical protein